jgi:cyclase
MNLRRATAHLLFFVCGILPAKAGPFDITFSELAPGVWAGVRPDGPRFPVMGSTTFVVSEVGVVVYDGGGLPIMSDKVIAKIRSITQAPVSHVIISHWHGDHNFGIYRFAEEYPNVQFVAHRFTQQAMNSSAIRYIDGYPSYMAKNLPLFREIVKTRKDREGATLNDANLIGYRRMIEDADEIDAEYKRARVTMPTVVIDQKFTIESGRRRIELLHLGHGNTEGDIVMWLPAEKVVATGDIVVLPTPYAFNVPPRAWAATLKRIKALNYSTLVPGHGELQRDTAYLDLLIETAESIADQRDRLLAQGLSAEAVAAKLDFSAFEERFTGGDAYIKTFYSAYFEKPLRRAAMKELSGEPMVVLVPAPKD